MSVMRVEVVSNEEHIYSGEASFVVVPTVSGELGIYPRHEPILILMKKCWLPCRAESWKCSPIK